MYFDIQPKTSRDNLFGLDYALETLLAALKDQSTRIIVIKGLRRMGKTSLMNVALTQTNTYSLKIDVRESPYHDRHEFFLYLIKKIQETLGPSWYEKILQKLAGVNLSYKDISLELLFAQEQKQKLFFAAAHKQLKEKNKTLILAFDEVQLLKQIEFDQFVAAIFDNYSTIKILLSGSEIGLLDKFLGKKDYQSALFGRALYEIELPRLKNEDTKRFLEQGFEQINKSISLNEITEVIEHFDGIIGWTTHYGYLRSKGLTHRHSLEKVEQIGIETTKRELNTFLEHRQAKEKYKKVLHAIARGEDQWQVIKIALKRKNIIISDSQLQLYLKELTEYGFIEKYEEKYHCTDPLLQKSVS